MYQRSRPAVRCFSACLPPMRKTCSAEPSPSIAAATFAASASLALGPAPATSELSASSLNSMFVPILP